LVIHAGNLEIIAKRNREEAALYITDVVRVHDGQYGKLQMGLYIAVIRDARARTHRLLTQEPPKSWKMYIKPNDKIKDTKQVRGVTSQIFKYYLTGHWQIDQYDVLEQAWSRNELLLVLARGTDRDLDCRFFLPKVPYRRDPPMDAGQSTAEFFTIEVIETFKPAIAVGRIVVDKVRFQGIKGELSDQVIIKSAHRPEEIAKLERDYNFNAYLTRRSVKGIPRVFGLFRYLGRLGLPSVILVLEYLGKPIFEFDIEVQRRYL